MSVRRLKFFVMNFPNEVRNKHIQEDSGYYISLTKLVRYKYSTQGEKLVFTKYEIQIL